MFVKSKCLISFSLFYLAVVYFQVSSGVIYTLNETEYKKLPPIYLVDPFEECMEDPQGLYCATKFVLVSDDTNPLLEMIQEFSAHTTKHYNHSLIRYNLCVTTTCKEYYNTTSGLIDSLEACFNKTFQDSYGLKTRVLDEVHCKKANEKTEVEVLDICMFVVLTGILLINIVGSLYDVLYTNGQPGEGFRLLIYFSIRRNWKKLSAPSLEGPENRLKRLKILSCLKSLSMMLVIASHSAISSMIFIENPKFIENLYSNTGVQVVLEGTITIQTFFIISGFLFAYNLELMSEKTDFIINWTLFPKGFIMRWIRLTPLYALVLFFTMTCSKFLVSGPFWHDAVMGEAENCRQYWWEHLLYINNYNDQSQCMLHSWYLASDTQLYCLGLIIYITCRTPTSRKVVLSLLMLVALALPVGHTYWQDLDGMLVISPEDAGNTCVYNRTFNYLYKRGHTNMFSYLVGMVVGFLVYYGQKINYDVQKLRKYRIFYYGMVPLGLAMILSGSIFYRDGPRPSMAVRLLFAAYQKPVWCLLLGVGMLGVIFKYERILRGIGEWHGWTTLSRLSYCAYIIHTVVIRVSRAQNYRLELVSLHSVTEHLIYILVMTYLLAVPCWLLVEQPFAQLMKLFLPSSPKKHSTDTPNGAKEVIVELTNTDKKNASEELTRV